MAPSRVSVGRRRPGRRGMTLLELLLALGLIALMSVMMFMFYEQVLRSREHGRQFMTEGHLARVIANKIAGEIRSCDGFLQGIGPGITGKERQITIQTLVLPDKESFRRLSFKDRPLPGQCDIRELKYYLAYDDQETHDYPDGASGPAPLGLVRSEMKTLFQNTVNEEDEESVSLDLLSKEIRYLRFRYFDGAEWIARWQLGGAGFGQFANTLPQAVEVTVGYDEIPPEKEDELDFDNANLKPAPPEPYSSKTYTVIVWLPQADSFLGSRLLRAEMASASDSSGGDSSKSGSTGGSK